MKHPALKHLLLFIIILFYFDISLNGQDIKELNHFINKNKIVDFELHFLIDSVPNNLNLLCKGTLKSSKGKQIFISNKLLSKYFSSNEVYITSVGRVILKNTRFVKNDTATFKIQFLQDSSLSKIIKIPVNYRGTLNLNYSGKNGINGKNGEEGQAGTKRNCPTNGSDGSDGSNGENGDSLTFVFPILNQNPDNNKNLITIQVLDRNNISLDVFKIDTNYSNVYISLQGGNGGFGGCGGDGGNGINGDRNNDMIFGQIGGLGGRGGSGGNGGNGGRATLKLQISIQSFLRKINVVNKGGKGGNFGLHGDRGYNGVSYFHGQPINANGDNCVPMYHVFPNVHAGHEGIDGPVAYIIIY